MCLLRLRGDGALHRHRTGLRVVGPSRVSPLDTVPHHGPYGDHPFPACWSSKLLTSATLGLVLSFGDDSSELSSRAVLPACSPPRGGSPDGAAARSDSSLGVVQRSPLRRPEHRAATPGRGPSQASRLVLRPGAATSRTRSALAVPPGSDGFLRAMPRRSVAPCCRPWGSSRFRLQLRHTTVRDRCTSDLVLPPGPGASGRDPRRPGRVLFGSGRPALAPSPGCPCRSPGPLRLGPRRCCHLCVLRLGAPMPPRRPPASRRPTSGPGVIPGALPSS